MNDLSKARHPACFFCGDQNQLGWNLEFFDELESTYAYCCPEHHYNGYSGILHGGIIAALLDEVMVQWLLRRSIVAMTADLQVRFVSPIRVARRLRIQAICSRNRRGLYKMEAQVLDGECLCALGKGSFCRRIKPEFV